MRLCPQATNRWPADAPSRAPRNLAGFVLLALALTRYLQTKLYSTIVDLQFDATTIVRLEL
jgi:hypothetical protein